MMNFFKKIILAVFFVSCLTEYLEAKDSLSSDIYFNELKYEQNVSNFSDYLIPKNSLAINLSLGTGIRNGAASSYFTNPFFYGVNFEIHRNNLIVKSDILIGFGKVKQTMVFSDQSEWEKGQRGKSEIFSGNIGYSFINSETITFAPTVGIGSHLNTSSTFFTSSLNPNEQSIFTFNVGFFVDFKFLFWNDDRVRMNNRDIYYSCLRFSLSYLEPIVAPTYSEFFNGGMLYFTIGLTALITRPLEGREVKR